MFSKKAAVLLGLSIFVATILFLKTIPAYAAPIDNYPVTVTQPDGTELHLFASGDEFYNWLHDEQGYTIIQDPKTGYYVYADLVNGELVPTKFVVEKSDPASIGLKPYLNISAEKMAELRQDFINRTDRLSAEIDDAPTTGSITNLVVFIRFSDDSEFTEPTSTYTNMLNSSATGANSLRNYYKEVSYNALTIDSLLFPTPGNTIVSYQDSHPRSYYQPYNTVTNPGGYTPDQRALREQTLLKNAIDYVAGLGQFPSGATIDRDGDGVVDSLAFVVSGGPDGWNELLWPHAWVMFVHTPTINGKLVNQYQFQLQATINNGVLAHETFHVLGGPDLYHYTGNGIQPVGGWDVMEYNADPPQHMGCYMKYKYGHWISSLPEISALGSYSLNPLTSSTNNCKKIASPYSTTEFFVVEYRNPAGSTFESSLPGTGLLVYRINTLASGNAGGPPDEIYIYRPGGTTFQNGNVNTANFSSDVGRTAINDNTDPSSFLTKGEAGGLSLCNIGASNATISFDICSADTTPPSGAWISPNNGQTISARSVSLNVAASDNVGGSGVKEVRFSAKWDNTWRGIGTANSSPYSLNWDMCSSGVPNGDVELGVEVWDNASNKWVYSEHYTNYHITKNYSCTQDPDTTPPTGYWTSPGNGQTITSQIVTLSVNASDNAGGSGVREVRWSAKWNDQWSGIGTDNTSPYSIDWDMCAYGVPNGDIELGMEVWDNANNKWVYSEHYTNYHINKNYTCITGGGWETWGWQNKYLAGYDNWHGTMTWENDYPYIWWDFGSGGPFGWGGDEFSLRMQRDVYFPGGDYSFHTQHDDGVIVYLDGNVIINAWWDGYGSHDAVQNISQGNHQIKVEFYENLGDALLHVFWYGPGYPEPDSNPPDGLITWPANNSAISSSPLTITADAWDDVSGVDRVEFYGLACDSACNWRMLGTDYDAPYGIDWDWSALTDQHVYLTIHVIDKSGKVRDDPGGYVEVDLDRTNPTANITTPVEGATVTGIVPIVADASDNLSGVNAVQFIVGYSDVPGSGPQDISELPAPAQMDKDGRGIPLTPAPGDYWRDIGWDYDGSDGWSVNWDTSGVPEQSGAAVFIYVYDRAWNAQGDVNWGISVFGVPGNDDFDSPILIDSSPYTNQQNTSGATSATDDPVLAACNRTAGASTVWYQFTPPSNGRLTINTMGSDYDTMLAVWSGTRGNLLSVGCNDDSSSSFQSQLTVAVSNAETYYIEVAQFTGYLESGKQSGDPLKTGGVSNASGGTLQLHMSLDEINPYFQVVYAYDWINGWEWQPNGNVDISVDGIYITSVTTDEWGNFGIGIGELVDIVSGNQVEVTDSVNTKTHIVTPLSVTSVEVNTDQVYGTAIPNDRIQVWVCGQYCADRWETVDGAGNWSANFSIPGDEPGEEQTFDVVPGTGVSAQETDDDGDKTSARFSVPNPRFGMSYDGHAFNGAEWQPNAEITISVNDVSIATTQTGGDGFFAVDVSEPGELALGSHIEVSDGVSTKDLIVPPLRITGVDVDTDIASGTGTPQARIQVWICDWSVGCVDRWETADGAGHWSANFSIPGDEGGEEQTFDIVPGTGVSAAEWDEDGDNIGLGFTVPNPRFGIWLPEDHLNGWDWLPNASVEVTVDDPSNGVGEDFSTTITSNESGYIHYEFQPNFDLQPGFLVAVSDGSNAKEHQIAALAVTGTDAEADTISGTTNQGSVVNIWICWDNGCANRHETADENGNWATNFGVPGNEPDEQATIDLQPGMGSDANQSDADGDFTQIHWRVLNPRMDAWYKEGNINAYEWPFGTHLTLEIEDTTTTASPDYVAGTDVNRYTDWDPNITLGTFNLNGAFDIGPGMILTISGADATKQLTVSDLTITNIDLDTDIITGTTEPNQMLWMWHNNSNPTCCRNFQADENGVWVVDYSQPGPSGEPVADLRPGSTGTVNANDDDGDNTSLNWYVPNPFIEASARDNWVHARDWPLGTEVTLTIDGANGPYTATAIMRQAPWNPGDPNDIVADFDLQGYDVQPGDSLTATVGAEAKTLIVSQLKITNFDAANDSLSGKATLGVEVQVCANVPGNCISRYVTANESGDWTADYSGEFDLQQGSDGWAAERDADGDQTWYDWRVPRPHIVASAQDDWVHAREWDFGTTVEMKINGISYGSAVMADPAPWDSRVAYANFDLGGYDVQVGDVITIQGSGTTKELTISPLAVTNVDPVADTLSGVATLGADVSASACAPNLGCFDRMTVADSSSGIWNADFHESLDIIPGVDGWVQQWDSDGDGTEDGWNVPTPHFAVRANENNVEAYEWPMGSTITLEIDNPGTILNPDYTETRLVDEVAPGDPNQTYEWFGLTDVVDIQPGYVVHMSDGTTSKIHTVTALAFTDISIGTDTVTGVAEAGSHVDIWACEGDNCINRHIDANGSGVWVADFSQPGDEGDEQNTFDITYSTWVDSSQSDEDGDSTMFGQNTPAYTLHAVPAYPEVHGHEWPQNTEVTLTIDDDTDPNNGVLYTQTKNVSDDPWCGEPCFDLLGVFSLQPGHYVTVTDGEVTKTFEVSALHITEVNPEADTISGTAVPGSWVAVTIFSQNGVSRSIQANSNGNWVADFSVFGDEDYEQNTADLTYGDEGRAIQFSGIPATGDGTLEYWSVARCYTLTMNVNPADSGTLTADPAPNCAAAPNKYQEGTEVTLTANPNSSWALSGWSGDASGVENLTLVTMDGDKNITASFMLVPVLNSPSGTLTSWNNVFQWKGVAEADYYHIEVYDANDNAIYDQWYMNNVCSGLDCTLSPSATANLANGDYKWRLQTYSAAGFGPWTAFKAFSLNVATLNLISPSDTLENWDNTFRWTGIAGADFFHIEVYDANDVIVFGQWYTNGICSGLDCAVAPTETSNLANGDYKWRVQIYSATGFGPWTEFLDFTLNKATVVLGAPSDTLVSWNNVFSWTGISTADYYRVEVYDAGDVMVFGQWYTNSICSGLNCEVSPAETLNLANGDYKWRVQTYSAAGYTPWTASTNFTLHVIPLSAPSGMLASWDHAFRWTGLADADYYRIEVFDANDVMLYGQWYTNSICTALDCVVSPAETMNLANGDYKWRIQTYNATGYSPWTAFKTFTLNVANLDLISPRDTLTSWNNIFHWTGVEGADYYQVEVQQGSDVVYSQWFINSICSGLDCTISPAETANLSNGAYQWRVRTYSAAGFSEWTEVMDFTLNVPTLVLLAPTGTLAEWDNVFHWTGISGADYYQLEVYDAGDILLYSQWYTNSICTGLDCTLSPAETANLTNGEYKWHVRTYSASGFSEWTDFTEFTWIVP